MISKELLSEVLELNINSFFIDKNICTYEYGFFYEDIGIYELAFKCKEWAYKNKYDIWSITWGVAEFHNIEKSTGTKRITATTEPEAIFKACRWVLNYKDN